MNYGKYWKPIDVFGNAKKRITSIKFPLLIVEDERYKNMKKREIAYQKKRGKYVPVGYLDDPYKVESFRSDGIWLVTNDGKSGQHLCKVGEVRDVYLYASLVKQYQQVMVDCLTEFDRNKPDNYFNKAKKIIKAITYGMECKYDLSEQISRLPPAMICNK